MELLMIGWKTKSIAIVFMMAASSARANSLVEAAQQFYDSNPACSTAKVVAIEQENDSLAINILIENTTKKAIIAMGKTDRENWLALHCPPETHVIWEKLKDSGDVEIIGVSGLASEVKLSCLTHFNAIYSKTQIRNKTVRARISKLLSKLGAGNIKP